MQVAEQHKKTRRPAHLPGEARKGAGLGTELRAIKKRLEDLGEEVPLVKADLEKLAKMMARAIETLRLAEDENRSEDEWMRAWLNTTFSGRVEKFVRELPEELPDGTPHEDNIKAKARFRRKSWRV